MSRGGSFVALIALATLSLTQPASAGGSWIEVSGGRSVGIGQWELAYAGAGAAITMRGDFSTGQQAPVSAGPWYAYLTPDDTDGVKASDPMLLGPVLIEETGGYPYVATVRFMAPSVPTGFYWVNVCDLGCTQGVGDLTGGTIVLGATGAEARLFARSQILTWMHEADARTIGHLREQREDLRAEVSQARRQIDRTGEAATRASARADVAAADVARRDALLTEEEHRADLWRTAAIVSLLAGLAAIVIGVWTGRRRRTVVPDTPADLVATIGRDRANA